MKEPFLTRFKALIKDGACCCDIHDTAVQTGFAAQHAAYDERFILREIQRVSVHQAGICALLEATVGHVNSILDVGCSSGGTSVALALSKTLKPSRVVGCDPNKDAVFAAETRALGYDLGQDCISFVQSVPGNPLPFGSDQFDLCVCVSVLEFVTTVEGRQQLVSEMIRVTRSGGAIFIATPSGLRLREFHSRRFLGNFRRRPGYPWSSSTNELRKMFRPCVEMPLHRHLLQKARAKTGLPIPGVLAKCVAIAAPWRNLLFFKQN